MPIHPLATGAEQPSKLTGLISNSRAHASAWHCFARTAFSACLVLAAGACTSAPEGSGGSGGGIAFNTGGSGAIGGASATGTGGASGGSTAGTGGMGAAGAAAMGALGGASGSAGTTITDAGATGGMGGASTGGAGSDAVTGGAGADAATGGTGGSSGPGRSAGCNKTPTLTFEAVPGESGQNVGTGEGGYLRIGDRGFAIRLPDNYNSNTPYWLVFGFHWNGGNSKEVDTGGTNGYTSAHFGLQKLSENGAIFVAPDGLGGGWANTGGRDLQFVDDMVELITENYCVDTTRIFANGFSYGGGMSYAIACARADVFRGVAIYNGAVLAGCEGGTTPIAYWQMAGLGDNICTVGAGRPMRDRFVQNNGCTAQEPPAPPQAPPYLRPGGHICTTYSGCSSEHPVRWCVHQSGHGNAIVDGTGDLFHPCANPPSTCSDSCPCTWVYDDVWTFFNSL